MGRLFSMDNKFFQFMGRVADLIILNLLFMVCCIPIVTIGPSLTALHYVTLKMARNEESYIIRSFFKSFRENLKQGILINIIMLAAAFILYLDFTFTSNMTGTINKVLNYIFMIIALLYAMMFLYVYPLLAKFYNTTLKVFRNSMLMAIRHLPYTFLMLIISASPAAILFVPSFQAQATLLMIMIFVGGALISYINARFFNKIFDKYIPEEDRAAIEEDSVS